MCILTYAKKIGFNKFDISTDKIGRMFLVVNDSDSECSSGLGPDELIHLLKQRRIEYNDKIGRMFLVVNDSDSECSSGLGPLDELIHLLKQRRIEYIVSGGRVMINSAYVQMLLDLSSSKEIKEFVCAYDAYTRKFEETLDMVYSYVKYS